MSYHYQNKLHFGSFGMACYFKDTQSYLSYCVETYIAENKEKTLQYQAPLYSDVFYNQCIQRYVTTWSLIFTPWLLVISKSQARKWDYCRSFTAEVVDFSQFLKKLGWNFSFETQRRKSNLLSKTFSQNGHLTCQILFHYVGYAPSQYLSNTSQNGYI